MISGLAPLSAMMPELQSTWVVQVFLYNAFWTLECRDLLQQARILGHVAIGWGRTRVL